LSEYFIFVGLAPLASAISLPMAAIAVETKSALIVLPRP
jgi:hypothetical protein